ncbi:TPA: hypothetical protein QHU19_002179 [Klebsiella aerogenes]|uniref:hypothetical protein n=1 Tax=Klebsiella aerogenes TaxID=548 RepID=UPI00063CB62E|nr:hypothetical protein [Klebsiella aerogenes]EKU0405332.1 hypothetical protein [Klebsiella aerogenes]EKW5209101.1 hypothetical protein [Klebsiella aerogenes]ELS4537301.1 hypothetical protein [Klebsiella aerogenes]EMB4312327.1 hypothetical protein [Klebsiella aerogenes]EMB4651340.1 hypothetical protein [Klebsiella aerogenes]
MKPKRYSSSYVCKKICIHAINMFEAVGTGSFSIAAVVCFIALDGWLFKLGGFAICFSLVCLISFIADYLRGDI